MNRWLGAWVLGIAMSLASLASAQAPADCSATIDKANMPSTGGTVFVGFDCPTPYATGVRADTNGVSWPGAGMPTYSRCPSSPAFSTSNFVGITTAPNASSTPRTDTYTWRLCDCASTACVMRSVSTTVAGATVPVPTCTLGSSSTTPTVGSNITLTASCSNSPTSYTWTNCSSTGSTCTATRGTPGSVTYQVTATNAGGTSSPATVNVTWQPAGSAPTCSVTASDSVLPVNSPVLLTASCSGSPTSYNWVGCSSSSSTCSTTSASPGTLTYYVSATNSFGTSPTVGVSVTWQSQATGPVPSCTLAASNSNPSLGQSITLTSSCTNSPTNYAWTGCTPVSTSCTDTVNVQGTKTYTLVASNGNGAGPVASVSVSWGAVTPPVTPPPEANVVKEATTGGAGTGFSAVIRTDGTLWSWGDNTQRTLGDGSNASRSVPGKIAGLENIVASTVGSSYHTLAVDAGGRVYAWGLNSHGELGLGHRTQQTRPTLVPGITGVVDVAAGDSFSIARKSDGTVWAWGRNDAGQLGDGSGVEQTAPIQVTGLSGIVSIAAGVNHVAVVDSSGRVYVWGTNLYVPTNQSSRPTQVSITGVASVFIGGDNTFARKGDGSVWAWGNPAGGRLGDGGSGDGRTPVQVRNVSNVTQVFPGDTSSMALQADGTLWGWGSNEKGQLGLGDTTSRSAPVRLTVPGVSQVAGGAAGDSHFVIDPLGRVFGAGSNELGTLGLGDLLETRAPELVGGITSATAVAASATQSIALLPDGSVRVWGADDPNAVGSANSTPHAQAGLAGSYIAIAGGSRNAVAVRNDGAVLGWGQAVPGSNAATSTTAVEIGAFTNVKAVSTGGAGVIALTNAGRALIACNVGSTCPGTDFNFADVIAVSAGETHFLVLRADGSVWGWGGNDKGQLGNGGTGTPSTPVQAAGLGGVRSIAAGAGFSIAVTSDGTTYAWGQAPPFTSIRTVPTKVVELAGVTRIAASAHVLALDGNGRAQAWGVGAKVGERDHLVPGREPRMDGLVSVSAGTNHSVGLTASGGVVAWGNNAFQQLGVFRQRTSLTWQQVNDPANAVNTQNAVQVVEYVRPTAGLGHFFITAYGAEQKDLDSQTVVKGWQRTGRTWRAWLSRDGAPANVKPVYRFFSSPFDTHFYTAEEAEKNDLIAHNPNWTYESIAFYAAPSGTTCPSLRVSPMSDNLCKNGPPTAVDCPSGYYPVYRAFDVAPGTKRTDPNHRFTSNWIDIYRNVRFFGALYEGVAFCSPVSSQAGGDLQAFHVYPGDSANAGDALAGEFWFANAGPGQADGSVIVASMPDSWTASCTAYGGAQCPGSLAPKALREGVAVAKMPAGGVLKLSANGVAPTESKVLQFASSIGAPSLAPDPYPNNNAAPVAQTAVKSAAACAVTLTPPSVGLSQSGSEATVSVSAPAGCAWSASGEDFALVSPSVGSGNGTIVVKAAENNSGGERSAAVTVSTNGVPQGLGVRQAALASTTCPSMSIDPLFAQHGDNQLPNNIVNVRTPTTDCAWDVKVSYGAGDGWIVLASPPQGAGAGQVEYAILANPTDQPRTATITIGGKAFSVHQAGANIGAGGTGGGDGGGDGGGGSGSGGAGGG